MIFEGKEGGREGQEGGVNIFQKTKQRATKRSNRAIFQTKKERERPPAVGLLVAAHHFSVTTTKSTKKDPKIGCQMGKTATTITV